MAKRLGNISKSSFRFLREASLYAYAGVAILGAFYLSYLAFSYKGEITELQPDVRSELIADSQINDLDGAIEGIDASIASVTKAVENSNKSNVVPVANQDEKSAQEANSKSKTAASTANSGRSEPIAANKPSKTIESAPKTATKTKPAVKQPVNTSSNGSKTTNSQGNSRLAAKTPSSNSGSTAVANKPKTDSGKYQWVLKSFNNPEFASNWVGKFKEMGLNTNVVKVSYDGKTWYRVAHGRYSSKAAARAERGKLPKIGDDYWISSVK